MVATVLKALLLPYLVLLVLTNHLKVLKISLSVYCAHLDHSASHPVCLRQVETVELVISVSWVPSLPCQLTMKLVAFAQLDHFVLLAHHSQCSVLTEHLLTILVPSSATAVWQDSTVFSDHTLKHVHVDSIALKRLH